MPLVSNIVDLLDLYTTTYVYVYVQYHVLFVMPLVSVMVDLLDLYVTTCIRIMFVP